MYVHYKLYAVCMYTSKRFVGLEMLNTLSMWGHTWLQSAVLFFLAVIPSIIPSIFPHEWKHKCNHHHGCSQPLSGLEINQAVKHSNRLCDASSGRFIRFYKLIQLKQPTQECIRMELRLCESTDDLFLSHWEKSTQRHFVWMQILRLHLLLLPFLFIIFIS